MTTQTMTRLCAHPLPRRQTPPAEFVNPRDGFGPSFWRECPTCGFGATASIHAPYQKRQGFIDQFQSDQLYHILGKSWILVNSAAREGLPNAFLEAAANRCAILSSVDPDGFSSQFGYHASQDDFAQGLEALLNGDRWRVCGEKGYAFVNGQFQSDVAIEQHLEIYRQLLDKDYSPS